MLEKIANPRPVACQFKEAALQDPQRDFKAFNISDSSKNQLQLQEPQRALGEPAK